MKVVAFPRLRDVLRVLAVTLGLLTMSACGGGWGGFNGQHPEIVTQPESQTVSVGQAATFSVTATGAGPLNYQWYKNGMTIGGAVGSIYTTPATTSSDSGGIYTVVVSNAGGTVTSASATVTVNATGSNATPPLIVTQPVSQTVSVGQAASFAVTANGTGPLSYQWYKNGSPISGATASTYATPPATAAGSSSYTVVVSNAVGTVTSTTAALVVNDTTPVASALICTSSTPPYNSTATLVPTFSGGAAVIGSGGVGSSDITGSAISGSSYVTPALILAKTYTLTVTGSGGAVASTMCTVTPISVSITPISPANQTIAPGTQMFTATASGGLTNNVTWSASGGSFNGNVWTSPSTPGTYTITATSVDNPAVSVTTTVIVSTNLPVITSQPISQNICLGSSTTLSVAANFASSYQWNLNGSPIPGATSSTYLIPNAIPSDAGNYSVTVKNAIGSVTSNVVKVVAGSSITSNPANLSISVTQTGTFSVSAAGVPPFSYQWYAIVPPSTTGVAVPGATSSTYTTPPAVSAGVSQFYATVTDACGGSALTSNPATLTVATGNVPPTITTQPIGETVNAGGTTTFSVTATGTPGLSYQWYVVPAGSVTGTLISGATSPSYTVPPTATTTGNDQDQYYAIVTNPYGQAVSEKAPLVVGDGVMLQIIDQPKTVYVNDGGPATLTVTATSNLPLIYQWYEAAPGSNTFSAIPGATSATYTRSSTSLADTGSVFYAIVSNGVTASVTSTSASLFVGDLSGVDNFCGLWTAIGDAIPQSSCSFQLTASTTNQHGEIVWQNLISTGNIQLSFTVATTTDTGVSNVADGFAMVLGDPSLGATKTGQGAVAQGLGAEGIPGVVLGFDVFHNPGDPTVPYLGVGRGETALWENPWFNVNSGIPALVSIGNTVSHDYVVSIVQGNMTLTMDGKQVFSGAVSVPPVAYLYFTGSTGTFYEQTVISNLSATVSAPSN